MGRRKLRFDSRKNFERKKRLCRAATNISVMPADLFIRLPITTSYLPSRVNSLNTLQERLLILGKLPAGWTSSIIGTTLVLIKLFSDQSPATIVLYTLTISQDFTWSDRRGDNLIPKDSSVFVDVPSLLQSVGDVVSVLDRLDNCKFCTGNDGAKFLELVVCRHGKFMNQSGS